MAIRERHQYKTTLGYHLRKGSELREIMNESAAGFVSGTLWGKSPALVIPIMFGAFGTAMSGITAKELHGDLVNDVKTRYEDHTISSHLSGTDGLSYSAIIQSNAADDTPYILVIEDGAYRLYQTEQNGDELIWEFIDSQAQALNRVAETLQNLRRAENELAEGNSDNIPDFADFDNISALLSHDGEIKRISDLPDTDMTGVPVDLSDHVAPEINLWQDAFDAIESGQYGFSITSSYNVVADDQVSLSTFGDAPHNPNTQLTLAPDVDAAATYYGGEIFLTGIQIIGGSIAGFSLLLGGIGGIRSGTREYLYQRRLKQRNGRTYG